MAQQTPEFKLVLVGDGGVGTYLDSLAQPRKHLRFQAKPRSSNDI